MKQPHLAHPFEQLPDEVARLLADERNPSWMLLSSPYRCGEEMGVASFRQPNLHSWITME
ncbi:hypothetical protein [Aneurinibacillus aneurinilyticus]|uniref:Uncharacterized protein n=2 Tax=Aneurinibacillus aneurinilyticus TaxID=1391 RepID=A0A848CM66_ANEAE|nr:hypothetical protein [Aneurinibacillus aneurinilyticus]ERI08317.1 hypothetical protein HMPREF0083_03599 [Aneurinibacillus aneurinilyticus ATCC 12856]MCI1692927.1 hypothetical protein [Aneurinibacillus aneurinilyticus]MED0669821.1 hypothetical protein [Aneurinibacillus aneurinilyticus]MED0705730.1 hypothetical protein [Aneurinibacillus aneurinilyticus]MED0725801.1 hypothetical protein [Aneurinibacillus aneurinilyticus]